MPRKKVGSAERTARVGDPSSSLPTHGPVVLQLVSLVSGDPHPLDGRYVKSFHPGPASMPLGQCLLLTTRHIGAAKVYASHVEAHAEWTRVDPRQPIGPNGKPNRPLTSWNVLIEHAPAGVPDADAGSESAR